MVKNNLPDSDAAPEGGGTEPNTIHIENFNHRTNDLDALRRLAQTSPELAEKYLDNSDRSDAREVRSTNIAMLVTGALAVFCLVVAGFILVTLGIFQTMLFVFVMLGVSHLLRVILTGKWSPTSWVGQMMSGTKDHDETQE